VKREEEEEEQESTRGTFTVCKLLRLWRMTLRAINSKMERY